MVSRIGIVGVGQIGGSLGLACRAAGLHVLGVDSSPQVLEQALARGAIARGSLRFEELRDAEVVVLAAPLERTREVAEAALPHLAPSAVLTDVGSVKGPIVRAIEALRPRPRFVGGHPMFGTEHQGIAFADARLLAGARFLLTPTAQTDPEAVAALEQLVVRIGMTPLRLSPEEHDRQVARVSHLPFLLAAALARVTPDVRCAGPAFRSMTRVAASPPAMWRGVLELNRAQVRAAAADLIAELEALLSLEDGALEGALAEAREARGRLRDGERG